MLYKSLLSVLVHLQNESTSDKSVAGAFQWRKQNGKSKLGKEGGEGGGMGQGRRFHIFKWFNKPAFGIDSVYILILHSRPSACILCV